MRSSRFDLPEVINHISRCFDETTKRLFKSLDDVSYIQFGSPTEMDVELGIQRGKLKLSGMEVASFFEDSIEGTISAIESRLPALNVDTAVLLVGGFGESPWLFQRLGAHLASRDLSLSRPDVPTNKAVAQGAIAFFLDAFVTSRMSRFKYGVEACVPYTPYNPEHAERSTEAIFMADGIKRLCAFSTILDEGIRVSETEEFRKAYRECSSSRKSLDKLYATIKAYKGRSQNPQWMDREPWSYFDLCTVVADTSRLPKPKIRNPRGSHYYEVSFEVVLLFGLTELKAQLVWNEDGVEKRGPAEIVYDNDVEITET